MNPFAKMPQGAIISPPTAPPILTPLFPALEEVVEKNENTEFLNELKDFMNDFASNDLDMDSIEEPKLMSKEQANFYIKIFNEISSEENEINSMCDSEIDRLKRGVNEFRDKKLKSILSRKEYISGILQQYAEAELQGKKTKTIKLPYGNLSFKKQAPKFTYGDDEAILLAIKSIKPDLVKVKTTESVDKALLKKECVVTDGLVYVNNSLINGVTVEPQSQKFEIKQEVVKKQI